MADPQDVLRLADRVLAQIDPPAPPQSPNAQPAAPSRAPLLSQIDTLLTQATGPAEATDFEQDHAAARTLERTRAAALADGGQLRPPTFSPPTRGTRDYLYQWTQGAVDLTRQTQSAREEDALAARYQEDFTRANPGAAAAIKADVSGRANAQLSAHLKALGRLNHAPPTGAEKLTAIDAAARDWSLAARNGQLRAFVDSPLGTAPRLGEPVVLAPDRPGPAITFTARGTEPGRVRSVPGDFRPPDPAAIRHVFGKLLDQDAFAQKPVVSEGELAQTLEARGDFGFTKPDLAVLSTNGPYGDERAIYNTMGGAEFLAYARRHLPFYVSRERWTHLMGQPVGPTYDGQTPIPFQQSRYRGANEIQNKVLSPGRPDVDPRLAALDPIPADPPYRLHHLLPVSPFVSQAITAGQTIATESAAIEADTMAAAVREKGTLLGPLGGESGRRTAIKILEDLARAGGGILNALSFGGFSALAEEGAELPERIGHLTHNLRTAQAYAFGTELPPRYVPGEATRRFRQARASMLRNLVTYQSDVTANQLESHAAILANFPNLPESERDRLDFELHSLKNVLHDRLTWWSDVLQKEPLISPITGGLARFFGLNSPAVQQFIATSIGSVVDDEAGLFMTTLFGPAAIRQFFRGKPAVQPGFKERDLSLLSGAQTQLSKRAVKVPRHIFTEFDDGTTGLGRFSAASLEDKTRMLASITAHIRQTITTPDKARALTARLQDVLEREGIPLDPTTEAWMHTAIRRAQEKLAARDSGGGQRLSDAELEAFSSTVAPPIADLPALDGHFVLTAKEVVGNKAMSRETLRREESFLRALRDSASQLEKAPRARITPVPTLAKIARGVLAETDRLAHGKRRMARADQVLADVGDSLDEYTDALRRSTAYYRTLRSDALDSYRALVNEEHTRTARLEATGGAVDTPNPAAGTHLYRRAVSALADHTSDKLRGLLLSRRGNLNRRAVERVGGPELLRQLDELHTAGRADDALGVWRDALQNWYRESSRPVARNVPARPGGPQDAPLKSIRAKIDQAAREGGIPDLTDAELAWLNQFRPGSPIPNLAGVRRAIRPIDRQILTTTGTSEIASQLRREINDHRRRIAEAGPGDVTLRFSPQFVARVRDWMDEPARQLFDGERTYLTLQPGPGPVELTMREAFDEALRELTTQDQLIAADILGATSREFAILPTEISIEQLRRTVSAADGALSLYGYEALQLERLAGRLTPPQRAKLFNDLAAGRDTGPLTIRFQRHRQELLHEALRAGLITPESFQRLSGAAYYHGVYFPSDIARRLNQLEAQYSGFLPTGIGPLRADPNSLKFKRPEDSFWVHWRGRNAAGKPADFFKKGFRNPHEAAAFLDTLTPRPRKASINPPVSREEKAAMGLIEDPVYNLSLTADMVRATNNYKLQAVLSRTRLAPTDADLSARGAEFTADRAKALVDGETLYRLDTDHLPHLRGRYLSGGTLRALNNWSPQFTWIRETVDAMTKAATDSIVPDSKYFSAVQRGGAALLNFGGQALFRFNTLFSATRVGMNIRAIKNGMLGNSLFYVRHMGLETLSPGGMATYIDGLLDAAKSWAEISTGKRRLADHPIWSELIRNDHVRLLNKKEFADGMAAAIEKHWTSARAIQHRMATARRRWQDAMDAGDTKLAAKQHALHHELVTELEKATRPAWRGIIGEFLGLAKRTWKGFDDFTAGKTRANRAIWDAYQWITLDVPSKYAAYRYLLEQEGLSPAQASDRLSAFGQHLHRVPEQIKNASKYFEGALFAGFSFDQARILWNTARFNAGRVGFDLFRLASINSALLYGAGRSPESYAAWWALRQGRTHNGAGAWLNWFQSMTRGVFTSVPSELGTQMDQLELGKAWIDVFDNQSPGMRRWVDKMLGTQRNPFVDLPIQVGLGALSRVMFNQPLFTMIAQGRDTNGNPINDLGDYATALAGLVSPPQAPPFGSDWIRFHRAAGGEERAGVPSRDVDPSTLRERPLSELLKGALAGIHPVGDSRDTFRLALRRFIQAQPDAPVFVGNKAFDEMTSTILARHGGFADPKVAAQIIEEEYAKNAPFYLLPSGGRPGAPVNPAAAAQALDRAPFSTARNAFNDLRVDKQIGAYTFYRGIIRGNDDPDLQRTLEADIARKIHSGRFFPAQILALRNLADEAAKDPRVPPDVPDQIRQWALLAGRNMLDRIR